MDSPNRGINVRQMISIFENQTFKSQPEEKTERPGLKRAKSMGQLSRKTIYKSSENIYSKPRTTLELIELQINKLQNKLNNYWAYSKDSHIYYQNELLGILTDIVNVESNEDVAVINKKKQLIDIVKQLNKTLNSRLPAEIHEKAEISTLTIKLPTQPIQKPETIKNVSTKENFDTVDDVPSVRKLRDLFEKKSAENNGLNVLVEEKSPKSFLSFNGNNFKYVPYKEVSIEFGSSVFEDDSLKTNGIVHSASIHREKVGKLDKLKAIFENIDDGRATSPQDSFEDDVNKFEELVQLETESPPISLQSSVSLSSEDESDV